MRFDRIKSLCVSSVFMGVCALSAPAMSAASYDGLWQVTIYTHSGSCEPTARYPLTVTDGRITAPGADVSGKVGPQGLVKVSIGPAFAKGQLSGNTGAGKWTGASGGGPCSGRWEASRQ